jgi:PAS domain S-box-containing protein
MSSKDVPGEGGADGAQAIRAQRLEAAVAESPTAIMCVANEMGRYVFVNQAFADLVGRSPADLMKSDPYEVWLAISTPEDFERQSREARRIAAGEVDRLQIDVNVRSSTGETRPLRSTIVGSRDQRGRLAYITVYYTSLEEQRAAESARDQAESRLLQAQKLDAMGKLAGGVAHDFNNRLLVILGYSELIKSRLPPEDELARRSTWSSPAPTRPPSSRDSCSPTAGARCWFRRPSTSI